MFFCLYTTHLCSMKDFGLKPEVSPFSRTRASGVFPLEINTRNTFLPQLCDSDRFVFIVDTTTAPFFTPSILATCVLSFLKLLKKSSAFRIQKFILVKSNRARAG